jgi:hypothetical protein
MDGGVRSRPCNTAGGSQWRIFSLISMLAATAGLVSQTFAQTRSRPQITFRVYNYARVAPGVLTESEQQAAMIFTRVGVDTAWVDCPPSPQEIERYSACSADLGATDVAVRILSRPMSGRLRRLPAPDAALGFAIPISPQGPLGFVYVLYHRVEEQARDGSASAGQILGGVIAHEVGHLLLGPRAHSAAGIMRAHWSTRELTLASRSHLAFVPQQAERLRAELLARTKFRGFSVAGK